MDNPDYPSISGRGDAACGKGDVRQRRDSDEHHGWLSRSRPGLKTFTAGTGRVSIGPSIHGPRSVKLCSLIVAMRRTCRGVCPKRDP